MPDTPYVPEDPFEGLPLKGWPKPSGMTTPAESQQDDKRNPFAAEHWNEDWARAYRRGYNDAARPSADTETLRERVEKLLPFYRRIDPGAQPDLTALLNDLRAALDG